MTTLIDFDTSAEGPPRALLRTSEPAEVAARLAEHGVTFERWTPSAPASDAERDADPRLTYAADVARLCEAHGYRSVDVVRVTPDHPDRAALREKFLAEHVHDDDEVRLFVEGSGAFHFRVAEARVLRLECAAGDLVSVPRGARHWFDTGLRPRFTALRFFTTPEGWIATFTGDPIATRFDAYEGAPADDRAPEAGRP